jgi:hypothetical protein
MVAVMMVAVVTVATVPIIRPVVVAVVWPIVPIRIIPIVPRSDPNAEEDLSVGTWRHSKGQAPRHDYN